ncbi:hypothetical protein K3727_17205 [Rhodobacteraceae bacterium M382]|nr:hypothetical protein K3727_17205 [Rhodobacteraceae bacterium M382]
MLNDSALTAAEVDITTIRELWSSRFRRPPLSGAFLHWLSEAPVFEGQSSLLCELLGDATDPGGFASLSNAFIVSPSFRLAFLSNFPEAVDKLMEIFSDRSLFAALRGQALQAVAILALHSPAHFRRLRSTFFSIADDEDERFIKYVSAIVGALSHHADLSEAEAHLERFLEWREAAAEARFQLGLIKLREGLDSSSASDAVDNFEAARSLFLSDDSVESGRTEAELFSLCLSFLLQCHREKSFPSAGDLESLRRLSFQFFAYHDQSNSHNKFVGSEKLAATQWITFASKLCDLSRSLEDEIWLEAARVIEEELFFLLSASSTIFGRDSSGSIEDIVSPPIVGRIQRSNYQLAATARWLKSAGEKEGDDNWQAIYSDISSRLKNGVLRNPMQVSEQALKTDTVGLIFGAGSSWTEESIQEAMVLAGDHFRAKVPTPARVAILEHVAGYLRTCDEKDDIVKFPHATSTFFYLLDVLIGFISERLNSPRRTLSDLAYLMKEEVENAKEEHFQEDLHSYLLGRNGVNLSYEPRMLGGGRADIVVNSENIQTVLELKRTKQANTSAETASKFAPQATTYQAAQTNFCFLGVLSLGDVQGEVSDLRDCIQISRWRPVGGETSYTVTLFKLQGNRVTPSELSKRPKLGTPSH